MISQLYYVFLALFIIFAGCSVAIKIGSLVGELIIIVLTIALLALVPLKCHAMTFEHAKVLFSHLENKSGYHVILELDPDLDVNAATYPHKIEITQGLLNFCKSDVEMVAVMAHEMGHWDSQDARKKDSSMYIEMHADVVGDYYTRHLGYKRPLTFMYHIRKVYGEDEGDGVHPGWTKRINNVLEHRK